MADNETLEVTESIQRYVENLMRGMAIVVDDRAKEEPDVGDTDPINTIIKDMTECFKTGFKLFPCPDFEKSVAFLNNASFVILDWNFDEGLLSGGNDGEYMFVGGTKKDKQDRGNIQFIADVLKNFYVPILIASNDDPLSIKKLIENSKDGDDEKYLKAQGTCKKALKSQRLYVCGKSELGSIESIRNFLTKWLKQSPTVRIYLYLNELIQNAKSDFFVNLEETVPNWPIYIYDTIVGDGKKKNENADAEFQEFIVSLFNSRLEPQSYENFFTAKEELEIPGADGEDKDLNIDRIYRQIKTQKYQDDNGDLKPSCGDVYQIQEAYDEVGSNSHDIPKYLLNITAPCDLGKPMGNPVNLFIPGLVSKPMSEKNYDKMSLEKKLNKILDDQDAVYTEYQLTRFVDDDAVIFHFSGYFKTGYSECNENGVPKYDTLNYEIKDTIDREVTDEKNGVVEDERCDGKRPRQCTYKRICRLVHPYITTIQDRFGYYIVRHGLPREPRFPKKS